MVFRYLLFTFLAPSLIFVSGLTAVGCKVGQQGKSGVQQAGDAGQLLALHELQGGTAAGGDVG